MFVTRWTLFSATTLWTLAVGLVVLLAVYVLFTSGSMHHRR